MHISIIVWGLLDTSISGAYLTRPLTHFNLKQNRKGSWLGEKERNRVWSSSWHCRFNNTKATFFSSFYFLHPAHLIHSCAIPHHPTYPWSSSTYFHKSTFSVIHPSTNMNTIPYKSIFNIFSQISNTTCKKKHSHIPFIFPSTNLNLHTVTFTKLSLSNLQQTHSPVVYHHGLKTHHKNMSCWELHLQPLHFPLSNTHMFPLSSCATFPTSIFEKPCYTASLIPPSSIHF